MGLTGLLIALGLFLLLSYPVGGTIRYPGQVIGLSQGTGANRRVLQNPRAHPTAVPEALSSARNDRWRRWIPGARCQPMALGFLTTEGWVDVELHCTSGFLFDYISREAWQ